MMDYTFRISAILLLSFQKKKKLSEKSKTKRSNTKLSLQGATCSFQNRGIIGRFYQVGVVPCQDNNNNNQ